MVDPYVFRTKWMYWGTYYSVKGAKAKFETSNKLFMYKTTQQFVISKTRLQVGYIGARHPTRDKKET